MTTNILPGIDLGKGERGEQRLAALQDLALTGGHTYAGKPSIGKFIKSIADQHIKEAQMNPEKITTVRHGFHAADLFAGYEDEQNYDVPASAAKYAELVEAELRKQYPGAEIETPYDLDASGVLPAPLQAAINDNPNHDDVPIIDHIAAQVYESYDWAIEN